MVSLIYKDCLVEIYLGRKENRWTWVFYMALLHKFGEAAMRQWQE